MANQRDDALVATSGVVYDVALVFWRTITNIFFREIRPRGAYNIPRDGPVIFVAAPHHNQFLDPLLLSLETHKETRRQVRFLIAAASMKRKAVGFFAGLMASIPVHRAADEAKPGTGTIRLDDNDPCLIIGDKTRFTEQLSPRGQVMLSKSLGSVVAEVVEILSDTQVRIKREFGGEGGKSTQRIREKVDEAREAGKQGIEFKCLPFIDQQDMYRHVYSCLKEGGCIGIFPEGGSHDRSDLLPLKAGVSVMALGAMASDPNVKVKIVPVGLSYFHPHKFRSRAVVEFGSALDVPPELVQMFKEGGAKKREAVSQFLDIIYKSLKTVTIRAPDYDTLMVIQAARRLYATPGQHPTLGQTVELNKRFLEGYNHFKDEPRIVALRENVLKYNRLVYNLGLRDHQVPRAKPASWKTFGHLVYRLGLLAVWTILALPGVVLNGPIFLAASVMSRKKAKEALAKSSVKIQARDVLATWKILISLGLAPILYGFYAFLATTIVIRAGAPLKWKILAPTAIISAMPFIGYAALKFGEAGMDVLKSLRPLLVALVPGQQKLLTRLKLQRAELANELADVINTFGPQMYEDFDEWRILVPSSRPPPSAAAAHPILHRRKSGAAVKSAENLLIHPMTWLDERLFGWSTSSRRGTSAWAGGSRSVDTSRFPTPEVSDDEDGGDYDNVLGYLPGYEGTNTPNRHRSRSTNGSYADLQKLRLTKSGASSTMTLPRPSEAHDGLHVSFNTSAMSPPSSPTDSTHRRPRRPSLSDGVPVERIGAVDRKEPFGEATEELNREALQKPKRKPTFQDDE